MKFFAVCTKPNYTSAHVYRLIEQLKSHYTGTVDFHVYTDRPDTFDSDTVNVIPIEHTLCERQWYKMDFMGMINTGLDEPIIVLDLDLTILRNIDFIIDMPIERNDFIAINRWWRAPGQPMNINGGMYKYYPQTCQHIFNTFYSAPLFWQNNYRQYSANAVTGEQYFVWEHARLSHNIKTFRPDAFAPVRANKDTIPVYNRTYTKEFGYPLLTDGVYNDNVCVLHGL